MNRCLKDQALMLLHLGEQAGAERAHLAECEACAGRYRQLGTDLRAIAQTLREAPPPKSVGHRIRPFTIRWLPAAVAIGVAVVLTWGGLRLWRPSDRAALKGAADEEIWSVLEGYSADFFLLNQALAEELLAETADFDHAGVVLEAEWPCDWYDIVLDADVAGMPVSPCMEFGGGQGQGERLQKPKS
jgi:hypothetical protein